ncbi:unnamed protein product [marine sediment metagenome]|uniref:Uncharacterized protein n=1 Tax=marine sediment metagenome TaxID=412755 RepID=X1KYW5_9ZZZZ
MQGIPGDIQSRLHKRLGKGGMGMNGGAYLLGGCIQLHCQGGLWYQVCGMGANDVDAQNLPVFCLGDELYGTCPLPEDGGQAVGSEGKSAYSYLV